MCPARANRPQAATHQQGAAEVIGHGQRVAVVPVAGLELPLEVGGPHFISRVGTHRATPDASSGACGARLRSASASRGSAFGVQRNARCAMSKARGSAAGHRRRTATFVRHSSFSVSPQGALGERALPAPLGVPRSAFDVRRSTFGVRAAFSVPRTGRAGGARPTGPARRSAFVVRRSALSATRYPVPGTRYPVPGTRYPLPGTRYPLPGILPC